MRGKLIVLALLPAALVLAGEQRKLNLDDLLQSALARDERVLAAHAQLDLFRARYDQARWLWFPTARMDVLFGGPVGQRRVDCATEPTTCILKNPSRYGYGDLEAGVSFAAGGRLEALVPLYTFGKISGAKRAARAGVGAGTAGIEKARQEVALEVRRAYYGWLLSGVLVEILEDGKSQLSGAERKLAQMLEDLSEEVTERDLFKLRYHSSQVQSMLLQARSGRKVFLEALRFLTGVEDLGEQKHLEEIELAALVDEVQCADVYMAEALQRRPELMEIRAAVEAAQAAVDVQRANLYPDFFISGYIKGSYSPAHDFVDNSLYNQGYTYYDHGLTLGLRLTLDIPQKLGRLEEARAQLRKIRAQMQQVERAIGLQIDKQIEELLAARENVLTLVKGQRAARAWMRANFMSYGVGISDTKDLLESLAAHAKARMELYRAHHDALVAGDRLFQTVGRDLTRTTSQVNPTAPQPVESAR